MKKCLPIVLFLFVLIACNTKYIKMNVQVEKSPDVAPINKKSFGFITNEKIKPEIEEKLTSFVQKELSNKGFVYEKKSPELLVAVSYLCNKYQKKKKQDSSLSLKYSTREERTKRQTCAPLMIESKDIIDPCTIGMPSSSRTIKKNLFLHHIKLVFIYKKE